MHRRSSSLAVALLVAAVALPAPAADAAVRVVANPSISVNQVKRETLAAVYLNRAAQAPNGELIVPVDQSAQSPVRASFSSDMLDRPVAAVRIFWAQQISQGARPPVVKGSDDEVVAFVAATPGAIGYVSSSAKLDGVKELRVVD